MYPKPDPTPYRHEIEDHLVPGKLSDPESDPKYLEALQDIYNRRGECYLGLVLDAAVDVPDLDRYLSDHGDSLTKIKQAAQGHPIGAAFVTDKTALLWTVIMTEEEVAETMTLAAGARPLTDGDLVDGYAFFRSVALQRSDRGRVSNRPVTSPIPQDQPPTDQRPEPERV